MTRGIYARQTIQAGIENSSAGTDLQRSSPTAWPLVLGLPGPEFPGPILLSCSPATLLPGCAHVQHCSVPEAAPGLSLCCLPSAPIYPEPSAGSQQHLPGQCHQQTRRGCFPAAGKSLIKMLNRPDPRNEPWAFKRWLLKTDQ